ncbi:MAG: NADH-quinone oxidoreductase subunit NuoE [Alphaproteobacteria bacterium]|nr:NADH-quinone oxidoreductase subunit NuoE [Alphaproteobacteria bacterium]
MSGPAREVAVPHVESFEFTPENLETANKIVAKYPEGRQQSAVMPLLDLAQRQHDNWLPMAAIEYIAKFLGMAKMRVLEVATFYTMYNLAPVGKYHLQLCMTTPCWLRGADAMHEACKKKLGIDFGETTPDGKFSMMQVECLGACVNAPVIQVNDDFYEDLDGPSTEALLDKLAKDEAPEHGSVIGRQGSAPEGGPQTLVEGGDD